MQYMNLLGACNGEKSLDAFVSLFFTVAGVSLIEERESSNYVDGRYFRGKIDDISFTVSYSDLAENQDLHFLVQIKSDSSDLEKLESMVNGMIRNKAKSAGFQFERILNFGRRDEYRVDY